MASSTFSLEFTVDSDDLLKSVKALVAKVRKPRARKRLSNTCFIRFGESEALLAAEDYEGKMRWSPLPLTVPFKGQVEISLAVLYDMATMTAGDSFTFRVTPAKLIVSSGPTTWLLVRQPIAA